MMKTVYFIILTTLLSLSMSGCVAEKSQNTRKAKASSTVKNGSNTGTTTTPNFATDESLYWFSSEKVTGTITVNKNTDSVIYLRGSSIHNFLSSKDNLGEEFYRKEFCLVANYGASNKQLRVRAIPIFISNFTTNALERILRVDIPSRNENVAACAMTTIDTTLPGNAAYSLSEICPSCIGTDKINSVNLKLFERKTSLSSLVQIEASKLSLSIVGLKVDLNSNSTSPVSSCTNSACEAKGFDCCIEGQCVKDATLKSSATSDPQYSQAISDYNANPLSFINYPSIFNICSNIAHAPPPPTSTPGPTPISAAEQRVKDYLADYLCIEKVESNGGYSLCLPAANETQYLATKKKLAIACGCPSTYSDNERAIKCPDWGVRPLYRSSIESTNNIVDFFCYTPVPENPIGPITNLNVSVPSRSAPHRFYATTGTNYDDLSKVASTITQEGDDFFYLDDLGKSGPVSGSYNFNSILGRMKVGLSQTIPAKQVTVELGKTYILSATSGFFTPCTQCAKDSWFQSFSAHPSTTGGIGLRASGYTTSRDTYSGNTTFGNYEDTKFGRACYVPITMLPFSHKKESNLQTQRLNRLKTQAAFYINGYQRDWFGFNKGALIGSFDGVSWFAVGSGRRITATSTKLYLAINGAFLDLADRTDTIVNIIPDFAVNTAADFDYDPTLAINDPRQNVAGSCQQFHQCESDADCVTQLGWEYTCADVSQMRTRWPIYDTEAKETANQERTGTIFEILQGTTTIGDSGKRCVYRGAGAPCVRDLNTLNSNFNKKVLTCAPNFYCASLTSNRFNEELVRSPNEFDDILFGMDANVLGRPLNYVTATKTLPNEVITNIKNNGASDTLGLTSTQADDMGICRPGKSLSTNPVTAHSNPDTSRRTDYISQISSCNAADNGNSSVYSNLRFRSCPAFDSDLNYADQTLVSTVESQAMENSCGGEAKHTGTFVSAFKAIEGLSLLNLQNITQPTLVQDACYRRAGSVCHTDLDCSPNKMHEESVGSLALAFFGGTEAEQSYWRESLVCSQGTPVPAFGTADFFNYRLNENRCCREIGKDFTMYTSGPASLIPENAGSNANLDTKKFAMNDPRASNRYSRYTVSPTAITSLTKSEIPAIAANIQPEANQWKVINETGSKTCCGGGWIRKFADGTHDWKVRNRLSIEASNFTCLNFRSPLAAADYSTFAIDNIVPVSYQREFESFCKFPSGNGCLQIPYKQQEDYSVVPPTLYNPSSGVPDDNLQSTPAYVLVAPYNGTNYTVLTPSNFTRLDTSPTSDPFASTAFTQRFSTDTPYMPIPFIFSPIPLDFDAENNKSYNFFTSKDFDYSVSAYLPAYIPFDTVTSLADINKIYIKYFFEDKAPEVVDITNLRVGKAACDAVTNYSSLTGLPGDAMGSGDFEAWCVSANSKTQNRPVLNVKAFTDNGGNAQRQWKYAGIIVEFRPLEITKGITVANAGNPYYYLSKLGRLELLGIPQITYEPIYCNNDQTKLVPGIFKSSITTRAQFIAASQAYGGTYPNPTQIYNYDSNGTVNDATAGIGNGERRFTYQDQITHSPVFSSKDFTCCTPLGKQTTTAAKCCSGHATSNNGKLTCKMPKGTNLSVYFNKFVSNEGVGEDQPGGGLIVDGTASEIDFNAYTGEPKTRDSTRAKLEALGTAFCDGSLVVTGGAFGAFPPEPFSGSYTPPANSQGNIEDSFPLSIVDSIIDFEASSEDVGKIPFDSGFRWNHQFYCK